jgi:hypothetical protein
MGSNFPEDGEATSAQIEVVEATGTQRAKFLS